MEKLITCAGQLTAGCTAKIPTVEIRTMVHDVTMLYARP